MSVFKKAAVGAVAVGMGMALAACSPPHEKDATNREHSEVTAGPTKPSLAEVPNAPSWAPDVESAAPAATGARTEQDSTASMAPLSSEKYRSPAASTPLPGQRLTPTEAEPAPAPQGAQAPAAN